MNRFQSKTPFKLIDPSAYDNMCVEIERENNNESTRAAKRVRTSFDENTLATILDMTIDSITDIETSPDPSEGVFGNDIAVEPSVDFVFGSKIVVAPGSYVPSGRKLELEDFSNGHKLSTGDLSNLCI